MRNIKLRPITKEEILTCLRRLHKSFLLDKEIYGDEISSEDKEAIMVLEEVIMIIGDIDDEPECKFTKEYEDFLKNMMGK